MALSRDASPRNLMFLIYFQAVHDEHRDKQLEAVARDRGIVDKPIDELLAGEQYISDYYYFFS